MSRELGPGTPLGPDWGRGTTFGRPRKVDFMARSEQILRVHHKNLVHTRSLQTTLETFDKECHRRLNKMQHDIRNVYEREYLPLRTFLGKKAVPSIPVIQVEAHGNRIIHNTTGRIAGRGSLFPLPDLNSRTNHDHKVFSVSNFWEVSSQGTNRSDDTSPYKLRLPMIPNKAPLVKGIRQPTLSRRDVESMWTASDSSCSLNIDEDRLEVIRKAVALTSEPPPLRDDTASGKRLRRSFLLQLRRETKPFIVVQEYLQGKAQKLAECGKKYNTGWRPSLSKNKILNDEDDSDDDSSNMSFYRKNSEGSFSSLSLSDNETLHSRRQSQDESDWPEDFEDYQYDSESTPDIFGNFNPEDTEYWSHSTSNYDSSSSRSDDGD